MDRSQPVEYLAVLSSYFDAFGDLGLHVYLSSNVFESFQMLDLLLVHGVAFLSWGEWVSPAQFYLVEAALVPVIIFEAL